MAKDRSSLTKLIASDEGTLLTLRFTPRGIFELLLPHGVDEAAFFQFLDEA